MKQYVDDAGTTHIDIVQTLTGGYTGSTELRTLDWQERTHTDQTFGTVLGRSRWTNLDRSDLDPYLKEGWEDADGDQFLDSLAINEEKGWTAQQIWGFAIVDGNRYHVRKAVVTKGDEAVKCRFVYNYTPPAAAGAEDDGMAY